MNELGRILKWIGDFESKESRDQYLKNKGHDLEKLDITASNIFDKINAKSKLNKAQKSKELFQKAKDLLAKKETPDLTALLSSKMSRQFAYQFSKLEKVNDHDMLSMLEDEQLLRLIEELED
jgi:hypothetical protein